MDDTTAISAAEPAANPIDAIDPTDPTVAPVRRGRRAGGLGVQLDRIRRFKWLVLAVVLLSALAAAAAVATAKPAYTGQAVLSAASIARAPADDAALAQGYVMFFNEGGYRNELAGRANVPADISSYDAQTAGLSPVFYVTATGPSKDTVQAAATAMAETFAKEINDRVVAQRDESIAAMTANLQSVYGPRTDPEALAAQTQLQREVDAMNADVTNQVTVLQAAAGVTEQGSGSLQTAAVLLFGGLLLGCAAAIAAAINSKKLATDYDVAEKLGIEVLDVLPSADDARHTVSREVRVQHLLNVIVRTQGPQPAAFAVMPASDGGTAGQLAAALARQRAAQGVKTVLVDADLRRDDANAFGLAQLLTSDDLDADVDRFVESPSDKLEVVNPGRLDGDPYTLFDRDRVNQVLGRLFTRADFVVMTAPSLARAGESQVLGDVSDGVLLVIDEGTRLEDAREAVRVLDQVDATLIGVVLVERKG